MSQVAEQQKAEIVLLKCLGIACPTGFQLDPVGYEPSYVNFVPGKASPLAKHYADYLIAQDPSRFVIEKAECAKEAGLDAPAPTQEAAPIQKPAKRGRKPKLG